MRLPATLVRSVLFATLSLVVACAGPPGVEDSPEERQKAARTIASLSVESGGLREMIEQGADLALASSSEALKLELKRELTEQEKERVRAIYGEALEAILSREKYEEILTGVIAANFTAPEMAEALAFYRTPTGAKILNLGNTLAKEVDAQADALFEENLDAFIDQVDNRLSAEFEELREGAE